MNPFFWQSPTRELKIGQRRKQIDAGAPRGTLWVKRITPRVPRSEITFFSRMLLSLFFICATALTEKEWLFVV